MLTDVFEKFENMCIKIYELDPAKFLSAPELSWQAAFKKTRVKLVLLTEEEKYINLFIDMQKVITNT